VLALVGVHDEPDEERGDRPAVFASPPSLLGSTAYPRGSGEAGSWRSPVAGSDGSCPATAVHGRQAWDRRRAEPRVVAVNSETEAGGRMPLTPPRWTVRSAIEPSVDSAPRGGTSAHRFGTTPSGDRRAPDRRTEGAHTRWAEHRPAGVREGGRPGVRGAARHRRFEL